MFGSNRSAAKAYARVGLETGVTAASPHKLIAMLFEGAMIAILRAQNHMQAGQIVEKGQAISKAISIIDSGLHASLNLKAGGEVAENLDALYGYMTQQLAQAHLKNDLALLQEVHSLLSQLKSAWDAIDPQAAARAEIGTGQAASAQVFASVKA
ncbi:MAG: flagellar export chaperone FliS [Burkholderiales bacterium]|nr:flagellar export chaperone FliS [Burkholderiales bacterium]